MQKLHQLSASQSLTLVCVSRDSRQCLSVCLLMLNRYSKCCPALSLAATIGFIVPISYAGLRNASIVGNETMSRIPENFKISFKMKNNDMSFSPFVIRTYTYAYTTPDSLSLSLLMPREPYDWAYN